MAEPEQVWEEDLCGGRLHTLRWEGDRYIRVWLPPNEDGAAGDGAGGGSAGGPLPCVWMHDGQNVFRDEVAFGGVSWGAAGTVAHLSAAGCIPRLAVVAVDHTGAQRPFDYLPQPPGDFGGMRGDMASAPGGGVSAYLARLFDEVMPWAERRFNLSPSPADRVLCGSSFGGVATLYAAMSRPDAFRGIIVESPSFWACGGRILEDVRNHKGGWPERFYLAMGGCEYSGTRPGSGEGGARCDRFLADACGQCAEALGLQGVGPDRLDWHVEPGAAHNERDWRRRFPRALRWTLAGANGSGGQKAPSDGAAVWTRPSPVLPGRPFELYADPGRLALPGGGPRSAHLGFDGWSKAVQTQALLPAGLPRECAGGVDWLAALAGAPEDAGELTFAFTDGAAWDNNGGSDYELPVRRD